MSIFDLDLPNDPDLKTEARLQPLSAADAKPTAGAGFGKGIALGLARGGAKAGRAVAIAGQALPAAVDAITGDEAASDWYQSNVLESTDTAVDYYTPRAGEIGKAGQIMGGLAEIVLPLVATAGNPALLVGSEALNTERELTKQGVDQQTASEVGLAQGVATAIGFKLPFLGNTLATRMGSGAAGNLVINAGTAGAQSEILKAEGYDRQAAMFDPLDGEARTIDVLTGLAFGGLAHAMARRSPAAAGAADTAPALQPSEQAAILTASNGKHFQQDTAPGLPADVSSSAQHQQAMDVATRQLAQGQRVSLDGVIRDASFLQRPPGPAMNALSEAVRNAYRNDLPLGIRWQPSQALASLSVGERRALRYDAPELNGYAAHVEQQHGLPPGLINAIKNDGERSNSNQVSPAGARGVMQFMPENLRKFGVADATDPVAAIDAAGRYLSQTMRQYGGNIDAVIADYNGGPRQAREVLAGRQPKAKETRDYLERVRRGLGRDVEALPPPAIGAADAFPMIPEELARTARAIDDEIQSVETARADLNMVASGMAELGEVSRMRAELPALLDRQQQLRQDGAVRELAKEIQAARPRTSYKQAVAQAETQRAAEAAELEARIGRLEGFLQQNREASQAVQQLALLDDQLATLRDNRAAIEVPAAVLSPVASAVRGAIENMPAAARAEPQPAARPVAGAADTSAPPVGTPAPPAGTPAPAAVPGQRQTAAESGQQQPAARAEAAADAGAAGARAADDLDVEIAQLALDGAGDIQLPTGAVDADGKPATVSARELMAEADADIQRAQQDATGFMAAVSCFLQRGT